MGKASNMAKAISRGIEWLSTQVGWIMGGIGANCTGFCTACFRKHRFPRCFRAPFESRLGHLNWCTVPQVLVSLGKYGDFSLRLPLHPRQFVRVLRRSLRHPSNRPVPFPDCSACTESASATLSAPPMAYESVLHGGR